MSFFLGPCRPHFWASSASYFDMLCKMHGEALQKEEAPPHTPSTWEEAATSFQRRNLCKVVLKQHHASRRSTSARCLLYDFAPLCTWLSGSPHMDVSTVAVWCHVAKTRQHLPAARGGSCEGSRYLLSQKLLATRVPPWLLALERCFFDGGLAALPWVSEIPGC